MDELDLSVDLTGENAERLAELISASTAEFAALDAAVGEGTPTPAQLARMTALSAFGSSARLSLARLAVNAPVPTVPAPAPVVEPAPEPVVETPVELAQEPAPNVAPLEPAPVPRVAPIFASADVPGLPSGGRIDFRQVGDAMVSRFTSLPKMSHAAASRTPFSNTYGVASLRYDFPDNLQVSGSNPEDVVSAMDRAANEMINLAASGGWCFGAGSLINTPDGLVPIEELRQDDMVLNHEGQAKRVALVLTRETQKFLLRVHGAQTETTPEHPLWARRRRLTKAGRKTSTAQGLFAWDAAAWVPAGELSPGDLVAFASDALVGTDTPTTPERAYLLGRYIGDGWTSRTRKAGNGRKDMDASFICSSHTEADSLEKSIIASEFGYSRSEHQTVTVFKMHADFRDWVSDLGAGRGAHEKTIPAQVFSWAADLRQAVLKGYTDADGHLRTPRAGSSPRMSVSTVSRALSVSCAQLVRTLGFSPGIKAQPARTSEIDGRTLAGSVTYVVDWTCGTQSKERHLRHDGMVWEVLQDFTPTEVGQVWDITVDDPFHSFIADGMVVHNCAPSETLYDFCEMESNAGLVSFPEIQAMRGGFFHTMGPTFSDLFTDVGFCFTEAQDIAGDYDPDVAGNQPKPCFTVGCPEFEETRLDVCGVCVRAGYLLSRAYPEMVDRTVRGILVGHRHRVASRLIATAVANSDLVSMPIVDANPGAISPILEALEMQALSINYAHRRDPNAPVEIIAPLWFHALVRADASRRPGVDLISLSNERINAWLRERGIMAQFVYNWQDLASPVSAWPDSIQILMYPAGTWVKATSGVIDLGVVHDSTLMAQNNYSAAFSEEGLALLKRCPESRRIVIPVCASGIVGQTALNGCSESPS